MVLLDNIRRAVGSWLLRNDAGFHDKYYSLGELGGVALSGNAVTPGSALQTTAVFACVRLLAKTVGMLPVHVYSRMPNGGRQRDFKHPLAKLLNVNPNPVMNRAQFFSTMQPHIELRGNAYAEIQRDGNKNVIALWPLNPDRMTVEWVPGQWRKRYLYRNTAGNPSVLSDDQVLHIYGISYDGLTGIDPITQARDVIGATLAADGYAASFFKNDARPGGVLTTPNKLKDEARANLKKSWQSAHAGFTNAQRTAVLEEGLTFQTIGLSPEQSQFLETRKFQVNEIARLFGVQPHLIGDLERATFSNIEHQGIEFDTYTMDPRLTDWELCVLVSLFQPAERDQYFAEFKREALLRSDTLTRYQAHNLSIMGGWRNRNEIRAKENDNPVDGLDEFLDPVAIAQKPDKGDDKKPEPDKDEPKDEQDEDRGNGHKRLQEQVRRLVDNTLQGDDEVGYETNQN